MSTFCPLVDSNVTSTDYAGLIIITALPLTYQSFMVCINNQSLDSLKQVPTGPSICKKESYSLRHILTLILLIHLFLYGKKSIYIVTGFVSYVISSTSSIRECSQNQHNSIRLLRLIADIRRHIYKKTTENKAKFKKSCLVYKNAFEPGRHI